MGTATCTTRSRPPTIGVEVTSRGLAGGVKLEYVTGREGRIAKATLVAISNTWRGSGDSREEEATAIQWTLWGKQAVYAAEYLGKGSHVNVVGRLRNADDEKDGETIHALSFTVEEIDYLDSRAEAEARRARGNGDEPLARERQEAHADA